jgi:hypothetical protein
MRSFLFLITICGVVLGASLARMAWSSEPVATRQGAQTPSKECQRCEGNGFLKCSQCKHGQVDCPEKCLKLSSGKWEHMNVPGHDPNELWQKFTGSRGTGAWTTAHVGEVIEIRKGIPENIGKCPMCEGKTRVPCNICQGAGTITCPVCRGNKVVPVRVLVPVRATSSPRPRPQITATPQQTRPSPPVPIKSKLIRLVDGRTIIGRITVSDSDVSWIRTDDGKTVEVPTKNILPDSAVPGR